MLLLKILRLNIWKCLESFVWLFNHWVHVEEYLNTATGSHSKFQEATLKIASTKALKISHRGPLSEVLRGDYHIPLCDSIIPRLVGTLGPSVESNRLGCSLKLILSSAGLPSKRSGGESFRI